jgi:hypothetical protein
VAPSTTGYFAVGSMMNIETDEGAAALYAGTPTSHSRTLLVGRDERLPGRPRPGVSRPGGLVGPRPGRAVSTRTLSTGPITIIRGCEEVA